MMHLYIIIGAEFIYNDQGYVTLMHYAAIIARCLKESCISGAIIHKRSAAASIVGVSSQLLATHIVQAALASEIHTS